MDEQSLTCSICLERYRFPVTVPCGHTFCKNCISLYWDKKEKDVSQDPTFNCPVCNNTFSDRPTLNRNVSLSVLSEAVAKSEATKDDGASYRAGEDHIGLEQLCMRHQKPLVFYCRAHRVCVCCVCSVNECKEHDRVMVEEERSNREEGLKKKAIKISTCKEETEQNILLLTENIAKAKVTLQQTSKWVNLKFSQLVKLLMEKQEVTESFVEQQQTSILSEAETQLSDLREKDHQLVELEEQINSLCTLPHCQFIQDSELMKVPQLGEVTLDVNVNVLEKLAPVTDVLSRITKLMCEDLDRAVNTAVVSTKEGSPQDKRPTLAVVPSPATPSYPAAKESLSQYHRSLSFDPCTANAYLCLSQNNRRAEHLTSGPHPVPAHDARFEHVWQVLCLENFTCGRHYWELEVSKPWAYVGVTYPGIPRKEKGRTGIFGMNELSWSLYLNERQLTAWHAGQQESVAAQLQLHTQPFRIGILLDYDEGMLAFYGDDQVRLHAFYGVFTHKLYPACWIGEGVSVTLCPP